MHREVLFPGLFPLASFALGVRGTVARAPVVRGVSALERRGTLALHHRLVGQVLSYAMALGVVLEHPLLDVLLAAYGNHLKRVRGDETGLWADGAADA